ncbi:MAG: TetR family transcriptional regulator [Candidatus Methanoplasma sp.]|jgi:AcrR family transcriptional regulator|nr:TetR family transcriptional regulator [Candidatus Methanoplasma sp.]
MSSEERMKIVDRTMGLLKQSSNPSSVTTRAIAECAEINPAMVNYYFGSKDALMKEAVRGLFETTERDRLISQSNPRKAMFDLLEDMCARILSNKRYSPLYVPDSILNDRMSAPPGLVELIRDYFQGRVGDGECRATAYQMASFLRIAAYRPEEFLLCSGIDMRNRGDLRRVISHQLDLFLRDSL